MERRAGRYCGSLKLRAHERGHRRAGSEHLQRVQGRRVRHDGRHLAGSASGGNRDPACVGVGVAVRFAKQKTASGRVLTASPPQVAGVAALLISFYAQNRVTVRGSADNAAWVVRYIMDGAACVDSLTGALSPRTLCQQSELIRLPERHFPLAQHKRLNDRPRHNVPAGKVASGGKLDAGAAMRIAVQSLGWGDRDCVASCWRPAEPGTPGAGGELRREVVVSPRGGGAACPDIDDGVRRPALVAPPRAIGTMSEISQQ